MGQLNCWQCNHMENIKFCCCSNKCILLYEYSYILSKTTVSDLCNPKWINYGGHFQNVLQYSLRLGRMTICVGMWRLAYCGIFICHEMEIVIVFSFTDPWFSTCVKWRRQKWEDKQTVSAPPRMARQSTTGRRKVGLICGTLNLKLLCHCSVHSISWL
jgi:hypothetical protein